MMKLTALESHLAEFAPLCRVALDQWREASLSAGALDLTIAGERLATLVRRFEVMAEMAAEKQQKVAV